MKQSFVKIRKQLHLSFSFFSSVISSECNLTPLFAELSHPQTRENEDTVGLSEALQERSSQVNNLINELQIDSNFPSDHHSSPKKSMFIIFFALFCDAD